MNKIRLLLFEEDRLLREAITALISKQGDFKVLAFSGNSQNLLLRARRFKPHVVLLDLRVWHASSFGILGGIKRDLPETKLIVLGLTPRDLDVVTFVKAGVTGFILKEATFSRLLKTVRAIAKGARVLPVQLTKPLFSQIEANRLGSSRGNAGSVPLTRRENEVVDLIGNGDSNKEIAQKLHVAIHTVKSHVHNILRKLALKNRSQIAFVVHAKGRMDGLQPIAPLTHEKLPRSTKRVKSFFIPSWNYLPE